MRTHCILTVSMLHFQFHSSNAFKVFVTFSVQPKNVQIDPKTNERWLRIYHRWQQEKHTAEKEKKTDIKHKNVGTIGESNISSNFSVYVQSMIAKFGIASTCGYLLLLFYFIYDILLHFFSFFYGIWK